MNGLIIGDTPSFGHGKFLTKLLQEVGIEEDQIQITSVVKEDVPVRENEMEKRKEDLEALVKELRPRYILLMGATAARVLLDVADVNEVRGKWLREKNNIPCLVTYHPAAALMDEGKILGLKKDLEQFSHAVRGRKRWRLKQLVKQRHFQWLTLGTFTFFLLLVLALIWVN